MKNTFRYMAAAAAILAAASCTKQEINAPEKDNAPEGTYQYILNVTQENDSKVSMDGNSILWSATDAIGVSCKYSYIDEESGETKSTYAKAKSSGGGQFITDKDNYTPATSATFTLNITEGYTPLAAGYPYDDDMRCTSGGGDSRLRYDVNIPARQIGKLDNIPDGAFAMVGKIDDNKECQMYNVGAVIKFRIKSENISSLKFEGNNNEIISGKRYYYITTGEFAYETSSSGTTSVTLVPEGTVFEPGDYYFVVSPNDLTEGFTMTLTTIKGQTSIRKTTTSFKIERNHKYTNFGSDDWAIDISTGAAGDLGSADGSTATLYGIVSRSNDIPDGDVYGFEISSDGENWTKYDGNITRRTSDLTSYNVLNVLTAPMTGLTPGTTTYYRAYYTTSTGATTYGTTKSFTTYADAESVTLDLYNGWDSNYWPFTSPVYNEDIKKGTSSAAVSMKSEFPLVTKAGHTFTAKAESGVWLGNSNGCFTMKVVKGDYLKLPVIEGKKPISVTLLVGNLQASEPSSNSNKMGAPSIMREDTSSETPTYSSVIGGGSWQPASNYMYNSHEWSLNGTDSGQHVIYFNQSNNVYISYIEVVYVNDDVEVEQSQIKQNLVFWAGHGNHGDTTNPEKDVDTTWPFEQNNKWASEKEFNVPGYPGIKYSFTTDSSKWQLSRAGLKFGGVTNNYMKFHAVTGYRLTYIKIRGCNYATKYSVTDGSYNIVAGGAMQPIGTAYDSTVEFTLTDTTSDTDYYLLLNSTTLANIREMWITYELVK